MQRADDAPELLPLFDAVAARPDDDEPRLVLADALQERGDPRGEFIALQVQRTRAALTAKQVKREELLFANHWRKWLADLPGIQREGLTFTRGFPTAGVLRPRGEGVKSLAWRSFEQLTVQPAPRPLELAAPALGRLTSVVGLDAACLATVLEGPERPRLRELGFAGPYLERARGEREQQQVCALTRFPSLKVLKLAPEPYRNDAAWLAWLFAAPLARQLERLRVVTRWPVDVSGLHDQLSANRLQGLVIEVLLAGVRLELNLTLVRLTFDDAQALTRQAQAINRHAMEGRFFPYTRFAVQLATGPASAEQVALLGPAFAELRRG